MFGIRSKKYIQRFFFAITRLSIYSNTITIIRYCVVIIHAIYISLYLHTLNLQKLKLLHLYCNIYNSNRLNISYILLNY